MVHRHCTSCARAPESGFGWGILSWGRRVTVPGRVIRVIAWLFRISAIAMRQCPQCQSGARRSTSSARRAAFRSGRSRATRRPARRPHAAGGYVILELVGVGGMGRVYRAEQTNLGRTVAVKIIHPHLVGEESTAARFITEARAASRLNHPNSVGIIDFGKTQDGQLYMVMEFLRGQRPRARDLRGGAAALRAHRRRPAAGRSPPSPRRTTANIIHRDLKPENIILEPMRSGGDFVKVVDFGLAKMRAETHQPGHHEPRHRLRHARVHEPRAGRGDPLDARSDLYSVGVILYQLLTGRLPFEAESPTQVVLAHLTGRRRIRARWRPTATSPSPSSRSRSRAGEGPGRSASRDADEFAAALARALARIEGLRTAPPSTPGSLVCPACGAQNPPRQKFCGECGASPDATRLPTRARSPPPRRSRASGRARADAPPEPSTAAGARRRPHAVPAPFVGREEDLAWLEDTPRRRAKLARPACGSSARAESASRASSREFLAAVERRETSRRPRRPRPRVGRGRLLALRRAICATRGPRTRRRPGDWVARHPRRAVAWPTSSAGRRHVGERSRPFSRGASVRRRRRRCAGPSCERASEPTGVASSSRSTTCSASTARAETPSPTPSASRRSFRRCSWSAYARPDSTRAGRRASASARVLMGLPPASCATLLATGATHAPLLAGAHAIAPLYVEQLLLFCASSPEHPRASGRPHRDARRAPPGGRAPRPSGVAVWGDTATRCSPQMLGEGTTSRRRLALLRRAGMIESADAGGFVHAHPSCAR